MPETHFHLQGASEARSSLKTVNETLRRLLNKSALNAAKMQVNVFGYKYRV